MINKIDKLRFGTAGIPICTEGKTEDGIKKVRELGLDSMELEFVRSVNITENKTPIIKKASKENNVLLSCHGQYFINFNSLEKAKLEASKQRIIKAAHIAWLCSAWSMTFHAGFYMKQDPKKVYQKIKEQMKEIIKKIEDKGIDIWLRPETTGKSTQWGDLKEICELSQDLDKVMPCIDFSHLHARTGGKENSYEEFKKTLSYVENKLGRTALNNMHIHVSGIEYTPKGERKHLILNQSDMNYKDLLKTFKEFKIKGSVICESPNIEKDALIMQKYYKQS